MTSIIISTTVRLLGRRRWGGCILATCDQITATSGRTMEPKELLTENVVFSIYFQPPTPPPGFDPCGLVHSSWAGTLQHGPCKLYIQVLIRALFHIL